MVHVALSFLFPIVLNWNRRFVLEAQFTWRTGEIFFKTPVARPMLVTTVVITLHLDVDGNFAHADTLHLSAREIQAVEQFPRLVTASFLLLLGRKFVERHLKIRINVIDHPADDS